MASATVQAELSIVSVVPAMTAAAIPGHGPAIAGRPDMTTDAAKLGVGAVDAEVGLGIVVEGPDAPVIRRVAVGALVAEVSLVDVIRPVAIHTFRRCAIEFLVDMT